MTAPLTAFDETERLAALERYAIVDTTPEDEFDELVQLASTFCGAPIALISLVDETRQWVKAGVGLVTAEIPRAMSFCAHALGARDLFIVQDARADPRFAENPLVSGEPHIRFYAGAPLITPDGHPLGTLCILDHHPRVLDDAQRAALGGLARQVVVQLELRRQISDKGAAEEALRASEARLQRVLEGSNDGFWDWQIDTGFVQFSERAATMLGYALSDLVPHVSTWERLIHPDDFAGVMAVLQDHLAGRIEQYETEHRLRCADGQWMWILDRGKVVERDQHGQPLRMAGTHTDVSERHVVERMKRDFISTVSHELRTPLTAIRGSLGLLASGVMGELPGEARAMVSIAERNSVRLIALINDILDFDRLESGKMEMSLRPTSLMRILERSIESISAVAVQEGVPIELHCVNANVMGDEERLMQVTVNLLSNAVKYSPRGDRVRVRAAVTGKDVEVRVEDHGRGIAPDLQKKLFHRFQRADSSDSRRKPGTGLGLAICKAIVEQHGGTVGVESEEGQGSTFWFRVPAAVEASERDVLLVEDDRALLEVMAAQLSATGLRVRTATSGWEGLSSCREWPPALLVLDLELPDLDGFGVVAALRNDQVSCSVPLLVFSGMDLTSVQRHRLQLGPTRFLVKGRATGAELCAAVTQLLAQPRARELS